MSEPVKYDAKPKTFNDGLEAALAVVSAHLNHHWQAKRARTHYPVGMVESELRLVEQDLFKARRK